jgi:FkbM family methyltransferase
MDQIKKAIKARLLEFWIARISLLELCLLQLEKRLERTPFFIQVGANDGVTTDPFASITQRWAGLLVEPQPESFAVLSRSRSVPGRIRCINTAVSKEVGEMSLFVLNAPHGRWSSGLASMDRELLERHIKKGYVEQLARKHGFQLPADRSAWIIEKKVPTMPLSEICRIHGINRVDSLLVDTEGHDFTVLQSFPWHIGQPELVIYEECHLGSAAPECRSFLESQGYSLQSVGMNTVATRAS